MLQNVNDRVLWLGVAAGLVAAYNFIPSYLTYVRDLTEVPTQAGRTEVAKKIGVDSEDALQASTLLTLANGPEPEVTASVIKVVAARICRPENKAKLLRNLASEQPKRRDKAITVVKLLFNHNALAVKSLPSQFTDSRSYEAFITALINVKPEGGAYDPNNLPSSPLRPPNRSAHEKQLLALLHSLLLYPTPDPGKTSVQNALEAGLVTRWLAEYPFPCAIHSNQRHSKSSVVALFHKDSWAGDDPAMANIFAIVTGGRGETQRLAMKQLSQVGLSPPVRYPPPRRSSWSDYDDDDEQQPAGEIVAPTSRQRNRLALLTELNRRMREQLGPDAVDLELGTTHDNRGRDRDADDDVRMRGGEDTAGMTPPPIRRTRRALLQHQRPGLSPEEESLRRRHREAMVVVERGQPLGRENILQREDSGTEVAHRSGPGSEDALVVVFNNDDEEEAVGSPTGQEEEE